MKKLLSIILAALMVVSFLPVNIEAAKFKDVPDSEWYAPYVNKAASAGVIKGYGDGTFKPKGNIAFTEITSLLANLVNVSEADLKVANATYGKDLDALLNVVKQQGNPGIDWARPAILKCLYAGVYSMKGLALAVEGKMLLDTKPAQRKPVDRTNTAGFIANALKLDTKQAVSLPYKDTSKISVDAHSRIQALIDIGVLSKEGDGTGNFRPNDPIDRASIAKMITVAMDYLEKNPAKPVTPPEPPKPVTTTIEGTVVDVTENGDEVIALINTGAKTQSVLVGYAAELIIDGSPALFDKITKGMKGTFTYTTETAKVTKATLKSTEETIEGKISAIYSTYRFEIEYKKGSILNNKMELDLRDADIYIDGSKSSLTDLDVNYEVKITKLGDKVTKVEAKRGDAYSDGTFYQFGYSNGKYYMDLYPNGKNHTESVELASSYIRINNDRVYVEDLVKSSNTNKYIIQGTPIKLTFDRSRYLTDIDTVFGKVENGVLQGYVFTRPSRNDNYITLSLRKSADSYTRDKVDLKVDNYTKVYYYNNSSNYRLDDLRVDDLVRVTMRNGVVDKIEVDRYSSSRDSVYMEGEVSSQSYVSTSGIEIYITTTNSREFNRGSRYNFKFDSNTTYLVRGVRKTQSDFVGYARDNDKLQFEYKKVGSTYYITRIDNLN